MNTSTRLNPSSTLEHINTIIFDIDGTLIYPNCPTYYAAFGEFIHSYIQETLGVDELEFKILDAFFHTQNHHIEKILLQPTYVPKLFEHLDIDQSRINWDMFNNAYTYFRTKSLSIKADNYFEPDYEVVKLLIDLKQSGKTIIALSNAPEENSRLTLAMCHINPEQHFDVYYPWKIEDIAPPKIVYGCNIFSKLLFESSSHPVESLSVGDSLYYDIHTANSIGMTTCHITNDELSTPSIANHVIGHVTDLNHLF